MQRLQISRYKSTKIKQLIHAFIPAYTNVHPSVPSLSCLQPDVPIPVVITAYADKTFDYVGLLII